MSDNVQQNVNLSPEQRRAIDALASGATLEQAAAIADRTEHTLRRWQREDDTYRQALQAAADQTLADAAVQLKGLLRKALGRLADILDDENAKPHHLLRAIDMTMAQAIRLAEFAELEQRVRALEERQNEQQH